MDSVRGATGSRLKPHDESPSDIAALHYKRGLKAAAKATKYEKDAVTSSTEKKKNSTLSKAQKQYRKAITLYKRALSVKPSLNGVRTALGYALLHTGHFEEAVNILDQAISDNGYDRDAFAYKTEALMKLEQLTGASQ